MSIAYSHEDNAICERVIKEVRRHLITLSLEDENNSIPWSDHLPFIQKLINSHINESTGYAPAEIRFGINNGKFSSQLQPATDGSASDWITRLSAVQKRIIDDVADKTEKAAKKARPDRETTKFEPESLVLVDLPQTRKGNLKRVYRQGPYKVLSQEESKVKVSNLATPGKIVSAHVSRVRKYKSRDDVNPVQEAARDSGEYVIESILDHKFVGKAIIQNCQVLVQWKGFPDPTWEDLSTSIRRTEAFVQYAEAYAKLKKFVLAQVLTK